MFLINALLKGILSVITSLLNIFLLPINALIENVFPDMSSAIGTFNTFINTYVGGTLSYFLVYYLLYLEVSLLYGLLLLFLTIVFITLI